MLKNMPNTVTTHNKQTLNNEELILRYQYFHELSGYELHDILSLRQQVFVVEQECPYQDADELDKKAIHICGFISSPEDTEDGKDKEHHNLELVTYARVMAPGTQFTDKAAIGRILTHKQYRHRKYARHLIDNAICYCQKNFTTDIKISAQVYLIDYYESFGFVVIGEEYLEDDIPHIDMVLASYI